MHGIMGNGGFSIVGCWKNGRGGGGGSRAACAARELPRRRSRRAGALRAPAAPPMEARRHTAYRRAGKGGNGPHSL